MEKARAQSALDGFDPGANGFFGVTVMVVQADGKILVGGDFTSLGGMPRNRIGRLNQDGTLDPDFNPDADAPVHALAVQADGKILVGGQFLNIGGKPRNFIARLNSDGLLDQGFDPGAGGEIDAFALQADGKILVGGFSTLLGGGNPGSVGRLNQVGTLDTSFTSGVNSQTLTLLVQPDGKIIAGGTFTVPRSKILRLNREDGSVDSTFDPTGANDSVRSLALQPDGKIVLAGSFSSLGGDPHLNVGRLNPSGTIDNTFQADTPSFAQAVALQADGKILVVGNFGAINGIPRLRIGRVLLQNGSLDPSFDPVASGDVNSVAVQADGKILAAGSFDSLGGQTRLRIGRLYPDGKLDANFDPGANAAVRALAIQPDGKVVVGGDFTMFGGGGTSPRDHIARTNPDGTLDPLDPGISGPGNPTINTVALQSDDKILVGGSFDHLGGQSRFNIGRLEADGSLDPTFDPGANGPVTAIVVQADGQILVGGNFTTLGGGGTGMNSRTFLGRLNPNDGTVDSFNPIANSTVRALAVQLDGKILAGGDFTSLGGNTRNRIGRLTSGGTVDGFNPGADGAVNAFAVQADGSVLVGGEFTRLGGGTGTTIRNRIGRLTSTGALDTFNPGANGNVNALAVQADASILVGGEFTGLGGVTGTTVRNRIGRLTSAGGVDIFDPGASDSVNALALQTDGKILVGGDFVTLGGGGSGVTPRNFIGRLTNSGSAVQTLSVSADGTIITWSRSSASPELDRVTFELSGDGANFNPLPDPVRVAGGWQLGGQSLSIGANLFIRARGLYGTGLNDDSGSTAESVRYAFLTLTPVITSPLSAMATLGQTFPGYQITATNSPDSFDATDLPPGLTVDAGTGLISGIPTMLGTFLVNLSATNPSGTGTAVLTLDVLPLPPQITSPLSAMATVNQPFTYQITATNSPTDFDATGLPAGLTVNTSTGSISGTPSVAGTFLINLSATNAGGTGTAVLTLQVNPLPPVITSSLSVSATVNQPFTYQITATNSPTSFDATGLPAGLTVNTSTGLISGTPSLLGTSLVNLSATNAGGTGTAVLTIDVRSLIPVIVSPLAATGTADQQFIYQIIATQSPTSYDATNLPAGLAIDTTLGIISGFPSVADNRQVALSASNGGGTGTAVLDLTVQVAPVSGIVIISNTSATGRVASPFSFQVITRGATAAARLSVSGLPSGLSLDAQTGLISGTPTTEGSFSISLTVIDGSLTAMATLQLTFTSDSAIPVIISSSTASLTPGQPFNYQIIAPSSDSDAPITYFLIGTLPAGLTFNSVTGTISGTFQAKLGLQPSPHLSGGIVTNVQLGATNSHGTATLPLVFFLAPTGPQNISTRLAVGTAFDVLIGGFIITGNAPKKVLIRAIGPSLPVIGALQDTTLELHDGLGLLLGPPNDNWRDFQEEEIIATTIPPTNEHESAILATLEPGAYTAIVGGKNNSTGVGLVEIYDLGTASLDISSQAQLVNISTRGKVQTADNVMIGGFILSGSAVNVLVRAIGPELAASGVEGALQDTTLELHNSNGTLLASNDDWESTQKQAIIDTTAPPTDPRESAIVSSLAPGAYTAIVRGKNGTTGVALVEAYVLP